MDCIDSKAFGIDEVAMAANTGDAKMCVPCSEYLLSRPFCLDEKPKPRRRCFVSCTQTCSVGTCCKTWTNVGSKTAR